ncbi:PGF-pre-PGF domain-containing protein [Haloferax namakaokahaiae]|uniref:PGF-pre-PGF domain-containing protein n=1 Tax=Haloferax namakaokahaiae TaxID=1748331 RepID=A0ABD5ZJ41_9EURY
MSRSARTGARLLVVGLLVVAGMVVGPVATTDLGSEAGVVAAATAPEISNLTVVSKSGRTIEVSFTSSKSLQQIDVGIYNSSASGLSGIEKLDNSLNEDDFSTANGSAPYHYTAVGTTPEDGNFTVEVLIAKGSDGINGANGETRTVVVDSTAPTISGLTLSDDTDGNGFVTSGDDVTVSATVVENTTSVGSVTANLSAFGGDAAESLTNVGGDTYETTLTVGSGGPVTEGNQSVTLTVTDTDGSGNERNATTGNLTIDTSAPVVTNVQYTGSAVGDGVVNDGDTFDIEATISDGPSGPTLDSAQLTADLSDFGAGAAVVLTNAGGDTYNATVTADGAAASPDGYYNITVSATDQAGQTTTNESAPLAISAPPDITAYSVTNPSGQNLTVSFDSSENLTDVEVAVTGPATTTLTEGDFSNSSGTYTATWNATTDGDFTAELYVANDSTGLNGGSNQTDTATIDTAAPTLSNATVIDATDGDGVLADGDQFTVRVNVSDDTSGVTQVTFDASDFGWGFSGESEQLTDGDSDGVYDFTGTVKDADAAADGDYAVDIDATDAKANTNSTTTGTLALDTEKPTLTNVTLVDDTDGDGIVEDGDSVEIRANSTDATSGVVSVTADASAFGADSNVTLTDGDSDGTYTATVTVNASNSSGEGHYDVGVTAADDGDNARAGTTNTLALNTLAPNVTDVTLADATNGNGVVADGDSVTISANVTDAVSVQSVTANLSDFGAGAAVVLSDGDSDGAYTATVSVDAANASADGDYSVNVTATDEKSKQSNATTGALTLDTTAPTLTDATISDDGDGLVADGDSLTVSVNVTDATTVGSVTANLSDFGAGSAVVLSDGDSDGTYTATVSVDAASASPDGDYSVDIDAADDDGNAASATTGALTLDATEPGSFSPSASDATNGDGVVGDGETISLSATVSDAESGVDTVTANLSDFGAGVVTLSFDSGTTYTTTATVDNASASPDGTYAITVNATDAAGNVRTGSAGSLTLDTVAPVVSDANLTDATNANGVVADGDSITVSANVTDATSIQNVTADASVFGAGTVELTPAGGDRYEATFTVDGANATGGSQSLTVVAEDAQNRTRTVGTGSLTVDTQVPTISGVSLSDDGDDLVGDGDSLTVSATVSDAESSVESVTANLSDFGAGASVSLSDGDSDGTYETTVTVDGSSASPDGNYSVTVTVADAGYNTKNDTTGEITLDTTAPTLTNGSVADATDGNGAVADGDQLTLSVEVADAAALQHVTADASAYGADSNVSLSDGDSDGIYTATVTASASGTTDGAHSVTFSALDTAGNEGTDTGSGPTLDTTPPTLTDASLTDSTDGNGIVGDGATLTFSVNVTDATTIANVTADASAFGAGTNVSLSDAGNGTYTATVTVDAANASADGDHDVTLDATDGQGNVQSTTTSQVTLDTTPATVTNVSLSDSTDGDGIVSDGDVLVVWADVTDATGVAAVTANASAFGAGTNVSLSDGDSDGTYSATVVVNESNVSTDGDQRLTLDATDDAGTVNTTQTGTLTLDTTAPTTASGTLSDASDGNGNVSVGDTLSLSVSVSDATTSVESVTAYVSDFGVGSAVELTDGDGDGTYETTVTVGSGASDGTQSATIVVEDSVGNTGSLTTASLTVVADGPSVTNATLVDTTDGDGSVADGDQLTIRANVSDDTGVSAVTADASDFGAGSAVVLTDTGNGTYEGTTTVDESSASEDGDYDVDILATDTDGNTQHELTNTLSLDTPPAVTDFTVSNPTGQTVQVSFSTDETLTTIVADVSGTDSVTLETDSFTAVGSGYVATWESPADGTATVTLQTAEDATGNDGANGESGSVSISGADDSGDGGDGGDDGSDDGDSGGDDGGSDDSSSSDDSKSAPPAPDPVVSVEDDERETNVSVENPGRNRPVAIDLGGELETEGMNLTRLTVTTDGNENYSLALSGRSPLLDGAASMADASGQSPTGEETTENATPAFDGVVLGSVRVDHELDDESIDSAEFALDIDAARLDELGFEADELALYRYHDGEWQRLETSAEAHDGTYTLRATSPGFSEFVVGVESGTLFTVEGAALTKASVTPGESLPVAVELVNPRGLAVKKEVVVTANGSVVGSKTVTLDAGERRSITVGTRLETGGVRSVSVDGVTAGTVTVRGQAQTPTATATTATTEDDSAATTTATPTTSTPDQTTTDTDTPGFGLFAAVCALLVVAGLARFRRG